jgi:hypothetical protein
MYVQMKVVWSEIGNSALDTLSTQKFIINVLCSVLKPAHDCLLSHNYESRKNNISINDG